MPDDPESNPDETQNLAAMGPYSNLDINVEELLEESAEELLSDDGTPEDTPEPGEAGDNESDAVPTQDDLNSIDTSIMLSEDDEEDPLDLDIEKLMDTGSAQDDSDDSNEWEDLASGIEDYDGSEDDTVLSAPPANESEAIEEEPPLLFEIDADNSRKDSAILRDEPIAASQGLPKIVMLLGGLALLLVVAMGVTLGMVVTGGNEKSEDLARELETLRQMVASSNKGEPNQLEKRVDHLSEQLSVLAHEITQRPSADAELNKLSLDALTQRLDDIEKKVNTLKTAAPAQIKKPKPAARDTPAKSSWAINLMSFVKKVNATAMRRKLVAQGHQADQQPVTVNGRTWHRVSVIGFPSRKAAVATQSRLARQLSIKNSWVEYRKVN